MVGYHLAEEGCSWKGEIKSLVTHLCHCEWVKVECIHRECGQWIVKISLAEHLEQDCEFLLVHCSGCQKSLPSC